MINNGVASEYDMPTMYKAITGNPNADDVPAYQMYKVVKAYEKGRADEIEECADKFAEILSNMTNVCGRNCPVKCNWGTEETCKNMCKKWFKERLKENIE